MFFLIFGSIFYYDFFKNTWWLQKHRSPKFNELFCQFLSFVLSVYAVQMFGELSHFWFFQNFFADWRTCKNLKSHFPWNFSSIKSFLDLWINLFQRVFWKFCDFENIGHRRLLSDFLKYCHLYCLCMAFKCIVKSVIFGFFYTFLQIDEPGNF